jgi:hypothetical protein
LRDALCQMFPSGIVRETSVRSGHPMVEISCIDAGAQPIGCRILRTGRQANVQNPWRSDYYLVRAEGCLYYIRVCTGVSGPGTPDCAILLGYAATKKDNDDLVYRALREMNRTCVLPSSELGEVDLRDSGA